MPEDRETELVRRFQAGIDQEESFRGIFALYHPRIMRYFLWRGFSQDESRDLTQESLFRIYCSLPTFRRESHFGRWAFEVVNHVFYNEMRRRKTVKRDAWEQSMDVDPLRTELIEGAALLAPEQDPLDQVIRHERGQALQAAFKDLPEQMRRCCKLRYEDGLRYQEIATVMKISIEMVKAHLHQGRKRLAEKLGRTE